MEGTEITTWRTAAASVAATKNLFRRIKDKDLVLAIMGSGVQAHIHAQAFMSYFSIKEVNELIKVKIIVEDQALNVSTR